VVTRTEADLAHTGGGILTREATTVRKVATHHILVIENSEYRGEREWYVVVIRDKIGNHREM
jgi:hypothetical protein